jgi:hypothetical protein
VKLTIFEKYDFTKDKHTMFKSLFLKTTFFSFFLFGSLSISAQETADCLRKLEYLFNSRGSYTVEDAIHKNVIIVKTTPTGNDCYDGKARVENGAVVSIFIMLEDSTYTMIDKKFTSEKKTAPIIQNGFSEPIITEDGDRFIIVFVEKLKPKSKSFKEAEIPEDL